MNRCHTAALSHLLLQQICAAFAAPHGGDLQGKHCCLYDGHNSSRRFGISSISEWNHQKREGVGGLDRSMCLQRAADPPGGRRRLAARREAA